MEDYFVKWGCFDSVDRSDFMTEKEARKLFDKKKLSYEKCQWVELWHEPIDTDEQNLVDVKEMPQIQIKAQKMINEMLK